MFKSVKIRKKRVNIKDAMLFSGVALFLMLLFIKPEQAMRGAAEGLILWYQIVLPSQLPFVVGVKLLLKINVLNNVPPLLLNWVIGLISGYPVGTMTTGQLYREGKLTAQWLTPLAACCNMAGPLFVVGTVGRGLLNDVKLGYYLLLVHWVCAGIMIVFPAWRESHAKHGNRTKMAALSYGPIGRMMGDAVAETASLMLQVGGFVVIFSVLLQWIRGPVGAVLEMTNGIRWVTETVHSQTGRLVACSFLINFSGFSVLMQSLGATEGVPISTAGYLGCKFVQGVLGAVLMYGICQFLGM